MVTVLMPDGEVLTGYYTLNYASATAIGQTSGIASIADGNQLITGYGTTSGWASVSSNNGRAYAILRGNEGTVMEVLVHYTGSSGFGQAVTNKGRKYGVQF